MVSLGAVGGALNVIGWGALNTYTAVVQGDFRNRHQRCHSIADMAAEVGGVWMRELCGALFIIAYVLCSGTCMSNERPLQSRKADVYRLWYSWRRYWIECSFDSCRLHGLVGVSNEVTGL